MNNNLIPRWHYGMLKDHDRTQFYEDIIRKSCSGKVILEIGSGSGLLSFLALKHGAKHIYAVEENPQLAEASQNFIERMGYKKQFTLFIKNSRTLEASEVPLVDVVLHEIFGSDPFGELVLPSLTEAKKFLKEGGIFLPESIFLTFTPRYAKPVENLVYGDVVLSEFQELMLSQHPALGLDMATTPGSVYVTSEIELKKLIETQNFILTSTSPQFAGVEFVELAFVIKHQEDSLLSYEIGSKEPVKHWSSFLLKRQNPESRDITFTIEKHRRLICK